MAKRSKNSPGAATPAVVALDRAGVAYTLHPYEHDPSSELSYGIEAAAVLGVPAERVFKTLVATVDDALVVGVVPVDGSLDLKALARALSGKRGAMAEQAAAERATGYVAGGISPLGQRQRLRTVIDESARSYPTIYVSAGRRGLDVELAAADLAILTGAVFAAVARRS